MQGNNFIKYNTATAGALKDVVRNINGLMQNIGAKVTYYAFNVVSKVFESGVETYGLITFEKSEEENVQFNKGGTITMSTDILSKSGITVTDKDELVYDGVRYALGKPLYLGNADLADLPNKSVLVVFNLVAKSNMQKIR